MSSSSNKPLLPWWVSIDIKLNFSINHLKHLYLILKERKSFRTVHWLLTRTQVRLSLSLSSGSQSNPPSCLVPGISFVENIQHPRNSIDLWYFQTLTVLSIIDFIGWNIKSYTTSGCKDIGIETSEFVTIELNFFLVCCFI